MKRSALAFAGALLFLIFAGSAEQKKGSYELFGTASSAKMNIPPDVSSNITRNPQNIHSRSLSPYLSWNTFMGSTLALPDYGCSMAVDQKGNIFLAGLSWGSWGAPIHPFGGVATPYPDIFVAKLNSRGVLQWNTFLGIDGEQHNHGLEQYYFHDAGMTLDQYGNIYVVCSSHSQQGEGSGFADVYAAKLNSGGAQQWLVALGSAGDDIGQAIAVDTAGNVYLGGSSRNTWGSPRHPFNYYTDAFVAKLNGNGVLQWNTFWGGTYGAGYYGSSGADCCLGLAVDANGNVYATGKSDNTWGFPIRPYNSYGVDAFVAKFNNSGTLLWNTFLGSAGQSDCGNAIAVDSGGNAYVTGASAGNWGSPLTPFSGYLDIFVAKLNTSGILQWNAFLGSTSIEEGYSLTLDSNRNIYVAGVSMASWGASERPFAGDRDAVAVKLDTNGNRLWNTFLGSSGTDAGEGIALDKIGNIFITGYSAATWGNPVNPFPGTSANAFAAKIDVTDYSPIIATSKSDLYFGAVAGGAKSSDQKFQISNDAGGILDWTLSSNRSWLSCTPTSGYGTGLITVSVNPVGIPAGTTDTSAIQIASSLAYNSPQTVNVHLTVMAGGATSPPFGNFATPASGTQNITGAIPVTGWVLDDIEPAKVEIWRDPSGSEPPGLVFIGNAVFVEGARPDVEEAYSGFPLNSRAGWGYMLLTNFLPGGGNGIYKLYAVAQDKEGNRVMLGAKIIGCSNSTAVKPFGTIDTPAQGGDATGNAFVNFGWVLTPKPKTVPKDGSMIDIYVDSVKVGNLAAAPNVYNQYRVDVATAFPGLNNSGGPVGAFYLDTTKYANGVHTIFWIATDDGGAADGIGSRYFNIMNTGTTANEIKAVGSTIVPDFTEALPKIDSFGSFLVSFDPVSVKKGFDLSAPAEMLKADRYGVIRTEIREVERFEVDLGKGLNLKGYLVVGDELRPLPIGSTLDNKKDTFSWIPGPGFLGTYNLIFIKDGEFGVTRRIPVAVTIRPKFESHRE